MEFSTKIATLCQYQAGNSDFFRNSYPGRPRVEFATDMVNIHRPICVYVESKYSRSTARLYSVLTLRVKPRRANTWSVQSQYWAIPGLIHVPALTVTVRSPSFIVLVTVF